MPSIIENPGSGPESTMDLSMHVCNTATSVMRSNILSHLK